MWLQRILPSLIIGPFLQLIFYLTRYKTACTQESGLTHAIIINVAVSMLCAVHDISFLLLCGTLYFSASWLNQKPLSSSCNLVPRPYSQLRAAYVEKPWEPGDEAIAVVYSAQNYMFPGSQYQLAPFMALHSFYVSYHRACLLRIPLH